jgi:hypothetical protein
MEFLKIVGGCIVAAILYGIAHDQVTARVYLPYFTVFHPPVFHTLSPTLQAFGWGVIATWWMGAFLGVLLAVACRFGAAPKLTLSDVVRPIGVLLLVMAAVALVSGFIGYKWGTVPADMAGLLSGVAERRFLADWWAHSSSYASGFFGGLFLCVLMYLRRIRARRQLH